MSEEQKAVEPEIVEPKKQESIKMQVVLVTLSDGRRGAFAGPMLISAAEMTLCPPRIVDVIFSEPRERKEVAPNEPPTSPQS